MQVLCLQETHSLPQDESKWQKEWWDKTQAVFNSNAEVAKKTDAGTAVLLNNPSLKFGTVIGRTVEGEFWPLKSDAIASVFKWSTFTPSRPPTQNKNEKVSSTKFTII